MKSPHSRKYDRFVELIISARHDSGYTQQQLADELGKPQSYVSKYERRERRLDLIEFMEIAEVLGIDPCQVFNSLASLKRPNKGRAK